MVDCSLPRHLCKDRPWSWPNNLLEPQLHIVSPLRPYYYTTLHYYSLLSHPFHVVVRESF